MAFLEGQPGTSAARERGRGFEEAIKEYPGIEVVARQPADFDRTKGMDVMSNMLQAHPDIGGVFAANDEMALGASRRSAAGPARRSRWWPSTARRTASPRSATAA